VVLENIHIPPLRRVAENSAGQGRGVQSHKLLWEGRGFLSGGCPMHFNEHFTVLPHVTSCGIVKP